MARCTVQILEYESIVWKKVYEGPEMKRAIEIYSEELGRKRKHEPAIQLLGDLNKIIMHHKPLWYIEQLKSNPVPII